MADDKDCFAVSESTRSSWQLVGAYFCYFSTLEAALNKALTVTYRLDGLQGEIIAGSLDFFKKLNLVGAAIGGQDKGEPWKQRAKKLLDAVAEINTKRVLMAHSMLQPDQGSVRLVWEKTQDRKHKTVNEIWDEAKFRIECKKMLELTNEVQNISNELKPTLTISIPDALTPFYINSGTISSARTSISSSHFIVEPPTIDSKHTSEEE